MAPTTSLNDELRLVSSEIVPPSVVERIIREIPGLIWIPSAGNQVSRRELEHADICFGLVPADQIPGAGRLRWIQFPFAGIPGEVCRSVREKGIILTNTSGIYDRTIGEHVLGMMFFWQGDSIAAWNSARLTLGLILRIPLLRISQGKQRRSWGWEASARESLATSKCLGCALSAAVDTHNRLPFWIASSRWKT